MPAVTIHNLIGAWNIRDFGARGDGNGDDAPAINLALTYAAAQSPANGVVFVPPGTYRILSTISLPSSTTLLGMGSVSVLRLGPSALVDVLLSRSTSNVRIKDLRIDGNRANNTSGNMVGIWLDTVTDAWLENVEAVSCRSDGIRLDVCTRVELNACKASDNGRHGISLANTEFCLLTAPRAYDNNQVGTAGDNDGINLELFSRYNTLLGCVCYETAGAGDRQGYGIRESSASACERNVIIGPVLWGNRTGDYYLDSGTSMAIATPLSTIPAEVILTA